ncbi:MAG: hypothetical protein K2M91_17090, partial [Lachnospiraceae bacterium]|nr:hypothetical protein [Lachnospiraceae bacterium]
RNGKPSNFQMSDWRNDGIEHYAIIEFAEDGTYKIEASCTDLADNASEKVQTELFTIDRTAPEIKLELVSDQTSQLPTKAYFNMDVTAVITVTEHNFSESDFIVNTTPTVAKGVWSHNGDVHTLQIGFDGEKIYHIDCAYTDLAGNTARRVGKDFTVDQTAPVISIEGVLDGSANMGEILPVVTVFDANMEESGVAILVESGTGESVENVIETAAVSEKNGNGFQFILRDMTDKADNVYYLTVTAHDRAGNTSELTYRFSLNRNGSVYDIKKLADFVENQYNRYDGLGEIQIVEMNVDAVDEFELYISRNGELGYKAKYIKEIIGSEETGYTYIYKIDENNFAEEGTYRLILYSKDRAGNEVNNAEDIHGREISFIVDNTAPKVIINGVESGVVYDVGAQTVQIVVRDNFKLEEAVFSLVNKENKVLESWDYMELAGEGETMDITIPKYNEEVSLLYKVRDAAGNEMQTVLEEQGIFADFSEMTDKQMQSGDNTTTTLPFGYILIVLAEVLACIVIFLIVRRKQQFR